MVRFVICSGLVVVFREHKAICTLTGKISDFEEVIQELDKMVLFCIVYMKRPKWKHLRTILDRKNVKKVQLISEKKKHLKGYF